MSYSSVQIKKPAKAGFRRKELRALISLMEDPDEFVQQKVQERLAELDDNSIPILDEIREEINDVSIRSRLTQLIHHITYPSYEQEFIEYLEKGIHSVPDLEKGQLLLSRFENPTLRTDLYQRQLDKMAARVEPAIRTALSSREQMEIFTAYFFEKEYFKGARNDYSHPDNSYLHKVLQRRRGIPISLSMVMMFVAFRLELPLSGINMPKHFLLKYETDNESILLDPFNYGRIVSMDQCAYFLRSNGITPDPSHFEKAGERDILVRTIRNLISSFEERGEEQNVTELKRLLGYMMQIHS